ncbi:MAG: DUF2330 domain-containing protein [Leptolyngbyaceae cyanobacterium T60_A2020_046]|nr:DUF2330 domain-containing protein [Leptolyngbyaceae cyanobacterium T60_A2020_046]
MIRLRSVLAGLMAAIAFLAFTQPAWAFCGFYVARADTSLYNQTSQVAIARNGDRTVLTMSNDYQGDAKDFALVVPVPTVITKDQVNVADPTIMARLDAFSAPRLVEYFDEDPCEWAFGYPAADGLSVQRLSLEEGGPPLRSSDSALGVTVEAAFSVGEYDILILSAEESSGLETWLRRNDYQIPSGAAEVLGAYIRQGMKFFVASVNLEEFDRSTFQKLRPLQISYESPRFMLPIRLGMVNARGPQELVVYLISPNGQTEITNYRTVEIPSNQELPLFIKDEFGDFFTTMFDRQYDQNGRSVAFLEYAWDMRGCDPCAADPLTAEELRKAGAVWIAPNASIWETNAFVTRLHVRYTRDKFPEDLTFQETNNRRFFQGRYVMNHPFTEGINCRVRMRQKYPDNAEYIDEMYDAETMEYIREYYRDYVTSTVPRRFERESQNLANLTGWDLDDIRHRISEEVPHPIPALWRRRYPPRPGR